jgi:hypothetical protein
MGRIKNRSIGKEMNEFLRFGLYFRYLFTP